MERPDTMKTTKEHHIQLPGRQVTYRLRSSTAARKLRIRVGPNGVEVVQPAGRKSEDVAVFLDRSTEWIVDQLQRVERMRGLRRPERRSVGEIPFLGKLTKVRVETTKTREQGNRVELVGQEIVVRRGVASRTPIAKGLENWLRKQARIEIAKHLKIVTARLGHQPRRVYIMGQRTKWGNCSAKTNLSCNWRLVLAPEFVLRYLVTHEAVHLAIPDHSAKFWLTVQSHCHETERAKQWLCSNGHRLAVDLNQVLVETPAP
jgi:predicted metal-dependent hydrolase